MKAGALVLPLLLAAARLGAQGAAYAPETVPIVTDDVARFWAAHDRLHPASTREDSLRAFAEGYFEPASPGLRAFIPRRLQKPENLLFALGMLPRYYAGVRESTLRMHEREPVIREALRRLVEVYPDADLAPVYLVVSGFVSQGWAAEDGLVIGAEMVSAHGGTPLDELPPFLREVDLTPGALPCIVVHELVHRQQRYPRDRTLLAQALTEGIAELVTELAVGCVGTAAATYAYGDANEAALWAEFREAMHGTDHSAWLYDGGAGGERPSNLGYWMGHRIARAYYERATDRRAAVRELLTVQDFPALLAASGYGGDP